MNDSNRRIAEWLGYAGLAPFFASAITLLYAATMNDLPASQGETAAMLRNYASLALYVYAAVILSFVGALHWGHALHRSELGGGWLVWSVMPALIGWIALMFPLLSLATRYVDEATIAILLMGFAAQLTADFRIRRVLPKSVLPDWFMRMRIHLTAGACGSLIVALFTR
jgi:hypothetical protein